MSNIGARIQNIVNVFAQDDMTAQEARTLIERILDGYGLAVPSTKITVPAGLDTAVRELAACGRKIAAIKAVREATGWGLRDSKDWVDRIAG